VVAITPAETAKFEMMLAAKVKLAATYGDTSMNLDSILATLNKTKQNSSSLKQALLKRYNSMTR
jgi:hypothetical protein